MRISTLVFVFIMVSTLAFSMQLDTTWKKIVASDSTFLQNVSNSRVILYTAPLASTSPDTNFPPVSIVTYQIFKVNPSERSHFVRVDSGVGFLADVTDIIVTQINGNIELGDVTIDAVPSFEDPGTGMPARALLDDEFRVMMNIGSETIGLVDRITDFGATAITVSVGTSTAVVMPDLGTARAVFIFSDQDVNFGGSGVGTGDAEPFIPGGAPFVKFRFSTNTPEFYFRGRAATASIRIWAAEE